MTVPFMANPEGPQASCRWDSRQGDHQGVGILLANRWIVNKNSSSIGEKSPFSQLGESPLFRNRKRLPKRFRETLRDRFADGLATEESVCKSGVLG